LNGGTFSGILPGLKKWTAELLSFMMWDPVSLTRTRRSVTILLNGHALDFSPAYLISQRLPYFNDPIFSATGRFVIDEPDLDMETVRYFFSLVLNTTPFSSIPADVPLRRGLMDLSSRLGGFESLDCYLAETSIGTYPTLTLGPGVASYDATDCFLAPLFEGNFDRLNQFAPSEIQGFLNEVVNSSGLRQTEGFYCALAGCLVFRQEPKDDGSNFCRSIGARRLFEAANCATFGRFVWPGRDPSI
jgi:hypothetical protein